MEIKYISDLDEDFNKSKKTEKKPAEQKKSEKSAESKKLGNIFQTFMRMSTFGKAFVLSALGIIIFSTLLFAFLAYSSSFTKIENVRPLSTDQETEFSALLNSLYPEKRTSILKELPYSVSKANLDVCPLRRTIEKYIEDALSDKILRNELKNGQKVFVDLDNDELKFSVE